MSPESNDETITALRKRVADLLTASSRSKDGGLTIPVGESKRTTACNGQMFRPILVPTTDGVEASPMGKVRMELFGR